MRKILFTLSVLLLILIVSCTQQSTPESDAPQTITGRVVTSVEEPSGSEEADYDICNNAQTYGLCDKLNAAFKDGYKELCCKEHGLCC